MSIDLALAVALCLSISVDTVSSGLTSIKLN